MTQFWLQADLSVRTLIEASAGTGKTYALEHLIMRLVVERAAPIGRILIVTFTRAATEEVGERIRAILHRLIEALRRGEKPEDGGDADLLAKWQAMGLDDARVRTLLESALRDFDDAAVFTIHGFCEKVLRQNDFSSGSSTAGEIADTEPLRNAVLDEWMRQRLQEMPQIASRVLLWGNWQKRLAQLPPGGRFDSVSIRHVEDDWLDSFGSDDVLFEDFIRDFVEELPRCIDQRKRVLGQIGFDDLLTRLHELVVVQPDDDSDTIGRKHETARAIAANFDAVLIDEFQDTDGIQYDIFRSLFMTEESSQSVFLVGDPKQAIYRFRGADIDTYLRAREEQFGPGSGGCRANLPRNFRSTPALVECVNAMFGRCAARAELGEGIECPRVESSPSRLPLFRVERRDGRRILTPVAPVNIAVGPVFADRNAAEADVREAELAANEIARLCDGNTLIYRDGAWRQLQPSDIAILISSLQHLDSVKNELARHGIRSISGEKSSVYETAEAEEIYLILRAMQASHDMRRLNSAMLTRLMGFTGGDLSDDECRAAGRKSIEQACECLESFGISAALGLLMRECRTVERLLPVQAGERVLTNYRHLLELLSRIRPGASTLPGLLNHLMIARNGGANDSGASQLRIPSEANAVRIGSLHGSKGLEYPVVYLLQARRNAPHVQKNIAGRYWVVNGTQIEACRNPAGANKSEDLAERVRLAYVAMTRASALVSLWLPAPLVRSGSFNKTYFKGGFAAALVDRDPSEKGGPAPEHAQRMHEAIVEAVSTVADDLREAFWEVCEPDMELGQFTARDLVNWQDQPGALDVCGEPAVLPQSGQVNIERRRFRPGRHLRWNRSSFSAITRSLSHASREDEAAVQDGEDARALERIRRWGIEEPVDLAPAQTVHFERGAGPGTALHEVLENTMKRVCRGKPDEAELERIALETLQRQPFFSRLDEETRQARLDWCVRLCENILKVQLVPGVCLGELESGHFQTEFDFMISAGTAGKSLTVADMVQVLSRFGYRVHAEPGDRTDLHGYLSGQIDLLFCDAGGRFWILDWKSNIATVNGQYSEESSDYTRQAMQAMMDEHAYCLQYLIYMVAVRRHLQSVLGIDADEASRRIAGAIYVFLRGVDEKGRNGIYVAPPAGAALKCLDHMLSHGIDPDYIEACVKEHENREEDGHGTRD